MSRFTEAGKRVDAKRTERVDPAVLTGVDRGAKESKTIWLLSRSKVSGFSRRVLFDLGLYLAANPDAEVICRTIDGEVYDTPPEIEELKEFWRKIRASADDSQEAQGCNNAPPQTGDSRVMPTGSCRQDAETRPGTSDTGT